MELESLSKESLVALILKLVESDAVSLQDLEQVIVQSPTPEMMQMTDMLHSTLCIADHETECLYYQEENMDGTWVRPAHAKWLRVMSNVSVTYKVSNSHIATMSQIISNATATLIDRFKDRRQLNLGYQLARQVFTDLIDENLPMLQDIIENPIPVKSLSSSEIVVVDSAPSHQMD